MSAPTRHPNVWDVAIALVFIVVGLSLGAVVAVPVHRCPHGDDRRRAADAATWVTRSFRKRDAIERLGQLAGPM
jgi:hypothetical protein